MSPQGVVYLFPRLGQKTVFCEAKIYEARKGMLVSLTACRPETIRRALPLFKNWRKEYGYKS